MSLATVLIVFAQVFSILFELSLMPMPVPIIKRFILFFLPRCFLSTDRFPFRVRNRFSWRAGIPDTDKTEFVFRGIYRYSRNPAFLGFDMMYAGILLMYFNWALFSFTIWAMVMLHLQILQEEKYLPTVFGSEYLEYKKHTCRYLGRK